MGLIDAVMGTAVSGYAVFKLTNFTLERVFFKNARNTARSLSDMPCGGLREQLVISNQARKTDKRETLCLKVMFDAPSEKFYAPIIDTMEESSAEKLER